MKKQKRNEKAKQAKNSKKTQNSAKVTKKASNKRIDGETLENQSKRVYSEGELS